MRRRTVLRLDRLLRTTIRWGLPLGCALVALVAVSDYLAS